MLVGIGLTYILTWIIGLIVAVVYDNSNRCLAQLMTIL